MHKVNSHSWTWSLYTSANAGLTVQLSDILMSAGLVCVTRDQDALCVQSAQQGSSSALMQTCNIDTVTYAFTIHHDQHADRCACCSPASLLSCSQGGLARLHEIRREDGSAQCSFLEQSSWQAAANVECMVRCISHVHNCKADSRFIGKSAGYDVQFPSLHFTSLTHSHSFLTSCLASIQSTYTLSDLRDLNLTIRMCHVICKVSSINIWHGNMRNGLQAVDISKAARLVALACNGSELSIWDLQQQQRSYQAKGNKPNRIGLVDKPWNTAVAFLPGSDGQKVVVGTAYHKLRLYDVKSRRPALDLEFGEAKITALAAEDNGMPSHVTFGVFVLDFESAT